MSEFDLETTRIKNTLVEESLDKRKMQARQISPNAVIVPYERAIKAIKHIEENYEELLKQMKK